MWVAAPWLKRADPRQPVVLIDVMNRRNKRGRGLDATEFCIRSPVSTDVHQTRQAWLGFGGVACRAAVQPSVVRHNHAGARPPPLATGAVRATDKGLANARGLLL
jgi:hypothetical protein